MCMNMCVYEFEWKVSNQGLVWLFDHFPQQEATSTAFEQQHPEAFLLQNKNTLLPTGHYVRQRYERVQAVLSEEGPLRDKL